MKLIKIIISAALVFIAAYGWVTVGIPTLSAPSGVSAYVAKGDKSFESKLYEDAYENYTKALALKSSKKVTQKQVDAYDAFYTEEEYGVYAVRSKLISVLDEARRLYPNTVEYALREIELYIETDDYSGAKKVCEQALNENKKHEELTQVWDEVIRNYTLDYNHYSDYYEPVDAYVAKSAGVTWEYIKTDGTSAQSASYEMMGQIGSSGLFLGKKIHQDSRFYDVGGVARGTVSDTYLSAGCYQEGLCPAEKKENEWYFLNLDGKEVLGPYRYAGCFFDGKAAVMTDEGKWSLIEQNGNVVKDSEFADIKLDISGAWINEGVMIAARKSGSYSLFDSSLEQIGKDTYEDADIPTEYGIYAVKQSGKWGYVNQKGEMTIEPQYQQAKSFRNGLAAVCEKGKWGFIRTDAVLVTDYQFNDAGYFTADGTVMIKNEESFYQMLIYSFPEELVK